MGPVLYRWFVFSTKPGCFHSGLRSASNTRYKLLPFRVRLIVRTENFTTEFNVYLPPYKRFIKQALARRAQHLADGHQGYNIHQVHHRTSSDQVEVRVPAHWASPNDEGHPLLQTWSLYSVRMPHFLLDSLLWLIESHQRH